MTREEVFEGLAKRGDTFVKKADESYIRVMTSNVMFTYGEEREHYEERADILAGMYLYYQPDFIGLQEVTADMRAAFEERLSDVYAFVCSPEGEKFKHGEWVNHHNYTPICYQKDRFDLLDHRYHVFPNCWSYQWAMYADKRDSAKRYVHMNLHYYPIPGEEQLPGFREVHAELSHLRRHFPRVPIFVSGDYNACRPNPYFDVMLGGLQMESGAFVAEDAGENPTDYWCHKVGSTELQHCGTAIDHVCVTTDLVDVKLHRVLHDELLCKSSDHCPRFLDIEIKEKEMP